MTIVLIGLIMTITIPLENTGGRYAGLLIMIMGAFINSPIVSAWVAGNAPEPGKRTLQLAINGWGNLSGVIGSELYVSCPFTICKCQSMADVRMLGSKRNMDLIINIHYESLQA